MLSVQEKKASGACRLQEPKPIPLVEDGAVLQVHMNEARNKLGLAKLASAISLVPLGFETSFLGSAPKPAELEANVDPG